MPHPRQNLNSSRDTFLLLGLKQQGSRERGWEMNKGLFAAFIIQKCWLLMVVGEGGDAAPQSLEKSTVGNNSNLA